jgi:uncharacterized protein (TIGR00369 family)
MNRTDNNPFLEKMGLKLMRWEKDEVEFQMEILPWQLNRQGILQGGVMSTLLDAACGYAGLYSAPGEPEVHGFTLSLAVDFIGSCKSGKLRAIGQRIGGGRQIFFARAEVFNETNVLVASGQGSFKYRLHQPEPKTVK